MILKPLWNYTVEIPGYEPLTGSVPFTVEPGGGAAPADGGALPSKWTAEGTVAGAIAGTFDWRGPIKYVKLSPGSTYGTATLKGTVSASGVEGTLDNSWAWKGTYQNAFTTGPLGAR